jgi:hypothetical protein
MTIWSIIRQFGIFYGHMIYIMSIWNIYFRFGMLYQEKSGNPALESRESPELAYPDFFRLSRSLCLPTYIH